MCNWAPTEPRKDGYTWNICRMGWQELGYLVNRTNRVKSKGPASKQDAVGNESEMASQKAANNKECTVTKSQIQDVSRQHWDSGKEQVKKKSQDTKQRAGKFSRVETEAGQGRGVKHFSLSQHHFLITAVTLMERNYCGTFPGDTKVIIYSATQGNNDRAKQPSHRSPT